MGNDFWKSVDEEEYIRIRLSECYMNSSYKISAQKNPSTSFEEAPHENILLEYIFVCHYI